MQSHRALKEHKISVDVISPLQVHHGLFIGGLFWAIGQMSVLLELNAPCI